MSTDLKLKSIIERIETLEEEKAATGREISEIYKQAGSDGYDQKIIRALISRRKLGPQKAEEMDQLVDTYANAIE